MKTLTVFLILFGASLSVLAQQGAAKCFENDALQGKQIARFKTNGNSVAGIFEIDAAGCKISVYLPGGRLCEFVEWQSESGDEKTFASSAIDRLTLKAITQTGNYLIMLRKLAEETQPRASLFKITN